MKRLLCLSLCVLFAGAFAAKGETVNVMATRTSFDSTLDQVILRMMPISGVEVPAGFYLVGLQGTWYAGPSGAFSLASGTNWASKLSNDGDAQDTDGGVAGVGATQPLSWLNMSTKLPDPASRSGGSDTLWNSFTVTYSITGANNLAYGLGPVDMTPGDNGSGDPGYGFDNTVLAVLYVTKSMRFYDGMLLFTGKGNYAAPLGGNAIAGIPTNIVFPIPEPSMFGLLVCALLAFGAYARRGRFAGRV